MNKIVYEVAEGTGAGWSAETAHKYAGGRAVVMTKSVKSGVRIARRLATRQMCKEWDEQGIYGGGMLIWETLTINGKSVIE